MTRKKTNPWRLPIALIVLGLIPIAGSAYRTFVVLATDAATVTNPDEARFFAMPAPILMHVIFGSLFLVIGAFQMSQGIRQRHRSWHRRMGWVGVVAGLTFAASGVWMVLFYPSHSLANLSIDIGRIVFGSAIVVFISLGILRAIHKDFASHRVWMIRGYALAASSGAQSYLIFIAAGINGGFDPALADAMMWLGWTLGIVIGERIARTPNTPKRHMAVKPT